MKKEKTGDYSGHYVIASSRLPERRPLKHRTLVPTETTIVCCPIFHMINKITEERHWGHSLNACNDVLNATLPRSVFFSIEPKSGLY